MAIQKRSSHRRLLIASISLLIISGCAATPEEKAANEQEKQLLAQAKAQGVTCKRVRKFGSNQIKQVCTSAEERAAEADQSRTLLNRQNQEDDFERAARQIEESPAKPQ